MERNFSYIPLGLLRNFLPILPTGKPPKKLLEQVKDQIRLKHYSYRTEDTYILFHNKRHPKEMGVPEIEAFLGHLTVKGKVAASTQNQALSTILFLYQQVLNQELDGRINPLRAKRH